MNSSCCEIVKKAFTLIPSILLKCMAEVLRLKFLLYFRSLMSILILGRGFVAEGEIVFYIG